jgi:hypothetical protein
MERMISMWIQLLTWVFRLVFLGEQSGKHLINPDVNYVNYLRSGQ